jgi:hypothetical protein
VPSRSQTLAERSPARAVVPVAVNQAKRGHKPCIAPCEAACKRVRARFPSRRSATRGGLPQPVSKRAPGYPCGHSSPRSRHPGAA